MFVCRGQAKCTPELEQQLARWDEMKLIDDEQMVAAAVDTADTSSLTDLFSSIVNKVCCASSTSLIPSFVLVFTRKTVDNLAERTYSRRRTLLTGGCSRVARWLTWIRRHGVLSFSLVRRPLGQPTDEFNLYGDGVEPLVFSISAGHWSLHHFLTGGRFTALIRTVVTEGGCRTGAGWPPQTIASNDRPVSPQEAL